MSLRDLIPVSRHMPWSGDRRRHDPFHAMQREMSQMFEDMWQNFDLPMMRSRDKGFADFAPRMDISETEGEIKIVAELPGMEEKDVEVTYSDGMLTIEGEHKAETEKKDEDERYYMRECSYGSFRRVIPVGDRVMDDKLKAVFKNGKLTVVLPKTKDAKEKTRKIPITH